MYGGACGCSLALDASCALAMTQASDAPRCPCCRFSAHRDELLLGTWLYTTAWMVLADAHLQPGYVCSCLATLTLALPVRFWKQAPLTLLANSQMMPAGSVRRLLHGVLLPLGCSYSFEVSSRRAFVRSAGARAHF